MNIGGSPYPMMGTIVKFQLDLQNVLGIYRKLNQWAFVQLERRKYVFWWSIPGSHHNGIGCGLFFKLGIFPIYIQIHFYTENFFNNTSDNLPPPLRRFPTWLFMLCTHIFLWSVCSAHLQDSWAHRGHTEDIINLPTVEVGQAQGFHQPLCHQYLQSLPGLFIVSWVISDSSIGILGKGIVSPPE